MAVDLVGEQLLQVGLRLLVAWPRRLGDVELVQACRAPGVLIGLDDEGRHTVADGVAVHGEDPVRALFVHEGQPVERIAGPEPDELGRRRFNTGPEDVREPSAEARVRPVGRDHQVIPAVEQILWGHRTGEPDLHPGVQGALLEQRQQGPARYRGHAVAAERPPLTAQPYLDGIPVHAVLGQRGAQHRIGGIDPLQRRVGEHDAEPEGIAGLVALEHGDLTARIAALGQQRGQQPSRATAQTRDAHDRS